LPSQCKSMNTKEKLERKDPLRELLEAAEPGVLIELVEDLVDMLPEVRRECFEYLKNHVSLSRTHHESASGEEILAIWDELQPDLEEIDAYGGGDYDLENYVADLICEIIKKLKESDVPVEYREELVNEILPYIQSGNSGLVDNLYDIAYAACYDNTDLRRLAGIFEAMQDEWATDHARRIYRQIGERKKYLELRSFKLQFGMDYYDLAAFYWDEGEKEKAIEVAEKGVEKGQGRLDELRLFLAQRAEESGDRVRSLELQFEQAVEYLTLEKYMNFKKLCTKAEWADYEGMLLTHLDQTWQSEALKICMHRREYDKALAVLLKMGYPVFAYSDDYELKTAKKLEKRFPEQVLKFYKLWLGNLNSKTIDAIFYLIFVQIRQQLFLPPFQRYAARWGRIWKSASPPQSDHPGRSSKYRSSDNAGLQWYTALR